MAELFASPLLLLALAVLVALALLFLLLPMLRGADDASKDLKRRRHALEALRDDLDPKDYSKRLSRLDAELAALPAQPTLPRSLLAALALAVPLASLVIYGIVGAPEGIDPPETETSQLRSMLGDLTDNVKENPADVESWTRLGMVWKNMQQFPAAESAFRRVLFNEPDNANAAVELAETLMYRSGQPHLTEEGRDLIAEVLRRDQESQKALWLAGMDALQLGQTQRAVALWERLETLLPEGRTRDQVRAQILQASSMPDDDVHAGLTVNNANTAAPAEAEASPDPSPAPSPSEAAVAADPSSEPQSSAPAAGPVTLRVAMELDPSLAQNVVGNETVFVFARAVNGPPAPLAVKRLPASALPTEVILSETDAMAEGLTLATFPQIRVSARISRTGNVIASSGDLEGHSEPLDPRTTDQVVVVIDTAVP